MSRKLDLRTGRPVWMAYRAPRVEASKLARDIRTDVLVVGMGISGAMIAERLVDQGLSVVMIDRRGPMLGSTPATTALVQYEIDQPLVLLSRMIGKEKAVRAWRRSRLAVANLAAHIRSVDIECALAYRPSLLLAGNVLDAGGLAEEASERRAAGIAAQHITPAPLKERFGIDRDGAIVSPDNLALDPRKLTAGLLLRAQAGGARLYAPAEAVSFEHGRYDVVVATRDGPVIRAGQVVLATGYELVDGVPRDGHRIVSTWAMATRPQKAKAWPQEAFVWEASDPYLYARITQDGRVVCGGEDEEFQDEERRDALIADKIRVIASKLGKLFPQLDTTPAFAWTGSFGSTATGLPIIGPLPRKPRMFAVMGYGGNGITFSRMASEMIANAICGRGDADAELFAFPRP